MKDFIIYTDGNYPCQNFNGVTYKLYPGNKYFSNSNKAMHREVWKHYNGQIPEGHDIHHKDGNKFNNKPSNLESVLVNKHRSEHIKERYSNDPKAFIKFQSAGVNAAKDWHKSEEGKKWHKEHYQKNKLSEIDYGYENCLQCGCVFKKKNSIQKFCHPNHKAKYGRALKKLKGMIR